MNPERMTAAPLEELRARLRAATLRPEHEAVTEMLAALAPAHATLAPVGERAARWVQVAINDAGNGYGPDVCIR